MAYVDLVVTPVVGAGWLVGEDMIDRYLIQRRDGEWGVGNGEWEVGKKTPFPTPHSQLESYGNRLPKFDTARAFAVRAPPGISRFFGRRLAVRGDQRDLHSA